MPIPILDLRIIVFRRFVSILDLDVLIKLSLCSTRCRNRLRFCRDQSIFYQIEVTHENAFSVIVANDRNQEFFFHVNNGGPQAARTLSDTLRMSNITMGENTFVTFWQDQCVGVRDIVEYCQDFFDYFLYRLVLINCDARDVTKILRYLPDPTRRLSIAYYGRFVGQNMRISLRRLRSFDIPSIHLTHSGITCFDLNAFLRYWQQGGSRRTRCLDIVLSRVNFDILFNETRAVERGQDVTRKYKDDDIDITITGGYDIRRNGDGRLATCGFWTDNSFKMFVWRRNQNR